MRDYTRREFTGLLTGSMVPLAGSAKGESITSTPVAVVEHSFRIRTITAGINLSNLASLSGVEAALLALERARTLCIEQGYEVQTIRIATTPFVSTLSPRERQAALVHLVLLDELVDSHGAVVSIGPVLVVDRADESLASWISELLVRTKRLSTSIVVASPEEGSHHAAAMEAAKAVVAVSRTTDSGMGNFRFAAAANIPAGTPFFPVAFHEGPCSIALGLESPGLVQGAFAGATDLIDATRRLTSALNADCKPVEHLMTAFALREGLAYLGIDSSPAPGIDRSIGAALETLIGGPFGSAGTLAVCAATTESLKHLNLRTCGYSGLMLPLLEDPILAKRAGEGRFGWKDLLLFSSVCGTGLDVVPLPGDTPLSVVAAIVRDTAALSAKLRKPLSARLFLVPGKSAGETASFPDPLLTDCVVMHVA